MIHATGTQAGANQKENKMDAEQLKEFARQKQVIMSIIADQIEQAKVILMDAKRVANDAGLEFNIDNLVYEVNSGNNWYNSNLTC